MATQESQSNPQGVERIKLTEFGSRKFLISIIAGGAIVACAIGGVNLSTAECAGIVVSAAAYVLGESWVDKSRAISDGSGKFPINRFGKFRKNPRS